MNRTNTRQLIVPGSDYDRAITKGPQQRLIEAAERAFARVRDPYSEKTRQAYRRAWEAWARWCEQTGAQVLPVDAVELVRHLEWLTLEGQAPNSVRLALAALATLDRAARVAPNNQNPESVRRSVIVQHWLKSWSRDNPQAPRRKAPALTPRQLRHVLDCAAEGPAKSQAKGAYVRRYARDRCLLLLGIYGALRVSEVCALELEDVRTDERGLQVVIRRSKTDQAGAGRTVGILPAGELALCPVEAWRQWLRARGDHAGPVFIEIGRDGELGAEPLTTRSGNRIVQRLSRRAGIELVSSHSMRATFVTAAVRRRVPLPLIAQHTGHKSIQTLSGYARQSSLFDDNPTAGLLEEK